MKSNLSIKMAMYNKFKEAITALCDRFPNTEVLFSQENYRTGPLHITYSIVNPIFGNYVSSFSIYGNDNRENRELFEEISIIQELFIYKPIERPCNPKILKRIENFVYNYLS